MPININCRLVRRGQQWSEWVAGLMYRLVLSSIIYEGWRCWSFGAPLRFVSYLTSCYGVGEDKREAKGSHAESCQCRVTAHGHRNNRRGTDGHVYSIVLSACLNSWFKLKILWTFRWRSVLSEVLLNISLKTNYFYHPNRKSILTSQMPLK